MYMCVYIYIYIERERDIDIDRDRDRERERETLYSRIGGARGPAPLGGLRLVSN